MNVDRQVLSSYVLKDLLRDSLGFDGLIFSDALNMKGASQYGGAAEVAYQAFLAGNDILVMAQDIEGTIALMEKWHPKRRNYLG